MNTTCRRLMGSGLFAAAIPAAASNAGAQHPNVLLIMADDFGIGSMNAYGAPKELVRTPRLNRLAEEGMRFTNATSPASVCSPTRYAMLTGQYAWRSAFPYGVHNPYQPTVMDPERPTVASFMQSAGYITAMIGKWHLGYGSESPTDFKKKLYPGPNDIGFDYHFGLPQNLDDGLRIWIENDQVYGLRSDKISPYARSFYGKPYSGFDAPQRNSEKAMEVVTDQAVDWIQQVHRDDPTRPFFLYFAPPAVHHPVVPSERMRGASDCGAYGDFIQDLDFSVGRVLDTLAYEGILDDTLIIFTSDNGGEIPDAPGHPETQARQAGLLANGPQRGDKHTIYQGGLQVPLIVRWPGRIAPGSESDRVVNLVDFYATLVDAFGDRELAANEAPDSVSFFPSIIGRSQPPRKAMVNNNVAGILALRDGDWKYIEGTFPGSIPEHLRNAWTKEAVPALYNLSTDPEEQVNVIATYPEIAKTMQNQLSEYRKNGMSR